MKRPSISAVICTRNRAEDLQRCLKTNIGQINPPTEIVIVDSSDGSETKEMIQEFKRLTDINIQYCHTQPGLTRQRNIGIQLAKGDIIAFLDDDILLDEFYYREILKCFSMSDDVVGVGGLMTNPDPKFRPLQKMVKNFFCLVSSNQFKGTMQRSGFANFAVPEPNGDPISSEVLCGCSCYKKTVFSDYFFDEFFEGYGLMEDVEFSYRVSRTNNLVVTPHAKFFHNCSQMDRLSLRKKSEMLVLNHYYIFTKHMNSQRRNWLFFIWSHLGLFAYAALHAAATKDVGVMAGLYNGHRRLFRESIKFKYSM